MSGSTRAEFYVECYLHQASGPTKIADLACDRTAAAIQALASTLAGMYRPEDDSRISLRLRGASPADVAAIAAVLESLPNASVARAWAAAGAELPSGRQMGEFNSGDCAPMSWVGQMEGATIGPAVWRDASWGNNAAPSWELAIGDLVLAEAFYYSMQNSERFTEHFDGRPYVSVVMFDEDENPTIAFETSPEDFLTIVRSASGQTESPAESLIRAAESVPQEGRIYWNRDI